MPTATALFPAKRTHPQHPTPTILMLAVNPQASSGDYGIAATVATPRILTNTDSDELTTP